LAIPLLNDVTNQFFRFLFPPLSKILYKPKTNYDNVMNHIKCKVILLYGKQASGKTECVRSIVEQAVKYYGIDYVNASVVEEGELGVLITYGLNKKLINILFCDNITLAKLSNNTIKEFFKIRHFWKSKTNRNYGYILAILASHRIHATPLELRTNLDAIIFRNAPTNPWDRQIVRRFIGEEALDYLINLDYSRENVNDLYKLSIVNFKNTTGILVLPLATNNYLNGVSIPEIDLIKAIIYS